MSDERLYIDEKNYMWKQPLHTYILSYSSQLGLSEAVRGSMMVPFMTLDVVCRYVKEALDVVGPKDWQPTALFTVRSD